jgi:hypothetical protein
MLNRLRRHKPACNFDFSTEDVMSKLKEETSYAKRGVEWGDFISSFHLFKCGGGNTIAKRPALATLYSLPKGAGRVFAAQWK